MTLRTRLTLAFFAVSVVPLSAVTLYSYYSSERAVRRAAEQQAAKMAADLGLRMDWVRGDLERRMAGAWPPAQPETSPSGTSKQADREAAGKPAATPDFAGHLAVVLGDVAPMFESFEIVRGPTPPPPPEPGPPPADRQRPGELPPPTRTPPASGTVVWDRPAAGGPGPASDPAGSVSVEMARVIEQAMTAYKRPGEGGAPDMTAWSTAMRQRVQQAAGSVQAAQDVSRFASQAAGRARTDRVRAVTEMKGADVDASVQRDGLEVGRIHARLNMPRIFRAVLPGRQDRGEVGFVIGADGEVHAADADKATLTALRAAGAIRPGAATRSKGGWVVVTRDGPSGITLGTARPLAQDLRELRTVAARNFSVGFGLIALVVAGSVPLAAGMTRNLKTLMGGVHAVAHGDLDARVPVKSNDEFGRLASAFNQMAEDLATHQKLAAQQERLRRELELCRQIQNEMLPHEPLRLGLTEVKGVSIPAREVGGDFFNYFVLPTGDIGVLVGDVSGKGVGAALLMANVQATLRAKLPQAPDLAKLAEELDRDLHAATPPEVYLTLFVGVINPTTWRLRYVNAGHNTQFVLRRSTGIEPMASSGRPLGLLPGGGYEERVVLVPPEDLLFFYTDGIVEAENAAGEAFGTARLEAVLLETASPGSQVDGVLARVDSAVRNFRGPVEMADDATIMALRLGEN